MYFPRYPNSFSNLSVPCYFSLSRSCWYIHCKVCLQPKMSVSCPHRQSLSHITSICLTLICQFEALGVSMHKTRPPALPADEATADGHLFALVHDTGGLAGHHPILIVPPGLAGSALHPGHRRGRRRMKERQLLNSFDGAFHHLPQSDWLPISQIYNKSLGFSSTYSICLYISM